MSTPGQPAPLAIIAGAGRFPFDVAQEARRQGRTVMVVGLKGWVDPQRFRDVERYEELSVGQVTQLIRLLMSWGVREAVMAGKVTKGVLFDPRVIFDAEAMKILARVKDTSVGAVLGAIAQRLSDEGVTLLDASTFLQANLCPVGVLTARRPTSAEEEDIRVGQQAARTLATLDVGQTVVVNHRVVVAVEALEGTDATIRRAGTVSGKGCVVVKVASSHQDRRFDLPVVGCDTMAALTEAGISCLAVEAMMTLLLERDTLIASANAADLCVIGVTAADPTS